MRLIDAEVVERNICLLCPNEHTCSESKQRGVTPIACGYMIAIDDAPTIDAEPIRRGRWKCGGICSECGFDICSECGYDNDEQKTDYCPNCGAKMY